MKNRKTWIKAAGIIAIKTVAQKAVGVIGATAPTAYAEVDFHDVPDVALWIIANVEQIAEAICMGVCEYFGVAYASPEADEYIGDGADWSIDGCTFAVENGIIRGKGYNADGTIDFAWGDNVTREELAVMLYRHYELVRELTASA